MPKTKVAVTIDTKLLDELDELIAQERFPNRSQAIERALAEKLERLTRSRRNAPSWIRARRRRWRGDYPRDPGAE